MPFHVPAEETLDAAGLAQLQREKLDALLEAVRGRNAFYSRKLADGDAGGLDALPFTMRAEIEADQAAHPPFGTNLTYPFEEYCRYHQTSGTGGRPLRCLDTQGDWVWWKRCWGIIYRAAGLAPADRLVYPFSFGPFIGFWSAFDGAVALGNLCLPAGGMTTTARLRYVLDNGVTFVCCTPTYALRMVEVAAEEGLDLAASAVRGLIVAGEPGGNIPATRQRIERAWGARVFDHAGMTEVGPWGFECVEAPGGLHVMESEFIPEVVDPQSGQPLADGEPGELVLTSLGRVGNPLIRYRSGDQVCLTRGRCACGRSFAWLEGGVLGRVDDMVVVRGNNVFPSAIEGILREIDAVAEFRVEVVESAALVELRIEVEPNAGAETAGLADRIANAVRDRCHFQPRVSLVEPGTLPRFEMKARRFAVRRNSAARRDSGIGRHSEERSDEESGSK